jgi:hypothetical protein
MKSPDNPWAFIMGDHRPIRCNASNEKPGQCPGFFMGDHSLQRDKPHEVAGKVPEL